MIKTNTHIVIKREDVDEYLNHDAKADLESMLAEIALGRNADGLSINSYYVCNTDEPYADEVLAVILAGEKEKRQ